MPFILPMLCLCVKCFSPQVALLAQENLHEIMEVSNAHHEVINDGRIVAHTSLFLSLRTFSTFPFSSLAFFQLLLGVLVVGDTSSSPIISFYSTGERSRESVVSCPFILKLFLWVRDDSMSPSLLQSLWDVVESLSLPWSTLASRD